MTYHIALAGKGGSGKTTIASLVIRYLLRHGEGPVLAVDADANANLGESLGLSVEKTVGGIIAEFDQAKLSVPAGLTKEAYLEARLNQAVVESTGLDLLTMGRGEGTGCYCYPNTLLRGFIDRLSQSYRCVVIDNEAGMEHLSRRTTGDVDLLLIVSDHSIKGVRTIARIQQLVRELGLRIGQELVVINRVSGHIDSQVEAELLRLSIEVAFTIPPDASISEADLGRYPLLELPDDSPAVRAVDMIMEQSLAAAQGVKR